MVSASIVGAIMGLGAQFYVNAVRKLPLMQNPWEHAIAAGAGAALGAWVVDFEKRTEKELTGTSDEHNRLLIKISFCSFSYVFLSYENPTVPLLSLV
jgi:hypothetical protein